MFFALKQNVFSAEGKKALRFKAKNNVFFQPKPTFFNGKSWLYRFSLSFCFFFGGGANFPALVKLKTNVLLLFGSRE